MSDAFSDLLEQMVPGASGAGGSPVLGTPEHGAAGPPSLPPDFGLTVEGIIGEGGTGWVLRAHDTLLDRAVAVKVARPELGAVARSALLREARLTSSMEHPAVLPVHRVLKNDKTVAVEYRLAPASTLEARLLNDRNGAQPLWSEAVRVQLVRDICGAVAMAHARDIVHGDLHPGNIAVDADGHGYLLDWTGPMSQPETFSGHVGYCAPERFDGAAIGPADDVYSLAAILWELIAGRPLRPRRASESMRAYIGRWRQTTADRLPEDGETIVGVADLCVRALDLNTASRPSAVEMHDELTALLTGRTQRLVQARLAEGYLQASQDALARHNEIGVRLLDERQVVTVQLAKVPRHAPVTQKRPLWEAESRVGELAEEFELAWLDAIDAAVRADALSGDAEEPRRMLSDLWWDRMRRAESAEDPSAICVARARALRYDDGRYARILGSPAHLSLTASVDNAIARISVFEEKGRVRTPRLLDEAPFPLDRHELAPGSYLVEAYAEGYAPVRYPVILARHERVQGEVTFYRADEVGEGWVLVPGGRFQLGGDPRARQPLERCTPTIGDRFIQRTCITSAQWLEWLNGLSAPEGEVRVPGSKGIAGEFQPAWVRNGDTWELPGGWDPELPIFDVSMADVEAYADWLSAREGRTLRLPTEEEWEKAARGVDGRYYPWGDRFDPTFAHMRQSVPGPPRPARVGTYPVDQSVYGCLDMAGGMRELTSSTFDVGQIVIRGGTWGDDADDLRCACRSGVQPELRISFVSARLITDEPRPLG